MSPAVPRLSGSARPSRVGRRTGRKLTVRGIKARTHTGASYGETGAAARQEILWDTEVPGLGLRVYPSGRRSWCLRYRVNGRRRIVTLGVYGVLTLEMARDEARGHLVDLKRTRKDPLTRPQEIPTIRDLISQYVEDRRGDVRKKELALVEQALGHLPVDAVEPQDVERAFSRWTEENGPGAANQAVRLVRTLIEFAVSRRYRDASAPNPAVTIKKNRERRRGRELTPRELEQVGVELAREEAERPDAADTVAAIRLLILTGARRREITGLTWSEVDLNARCLRIADSKTGAKVVPLSSAALEVLSAATRRPGEERVFPATRHEVGYAVQYTWKRVRKRAGCECARLHDLRHTFVTRGLAANFTETIVGKIVGHRSAATTRRYKHLGTDPLREAVERIGIDLADDLGRREMQGAGLELEGQSTDS
jgi:integrase